MEITNQIVTINFRGSLRYFVCFKGCRRYKTITSQNMSSEAYAKNFFIL